MAPVETRKNLLTGSLPRIYSIAGVRMRWFFAWPGFLRKKSGPQAGSFMGDSTWDGEGSRNDGAKPPGKMFGNLRFRNDTPR